jgi:hypothetical protein
LRGADVLPSHSHKRYRGVGAPITKPQQFSVLAFSLTVCHKACPGGACPGGDDGGGGAVATAAGCNVQEVDASKPPLTSSTVEKESSHTHLCGCTASTDSLIRPRDTPSAPQVETPVGHATTAQSISPPVTTIRRAHPVLFFLTLSMSHGDG